MVNLRFYHGANKKVAAHECLAQRRRWAGLAVASLYVIGAFGKAGLTSLGALACLTGFGVFFLLGRFDGLAGAGASRNVGTLGSGASRCEGAVFRGDGADLFGVGAVGAAGEEGDGDGVAPTTLGSGASWGVACGWISAGLCRRLGAWPC